VRRFPNREVNLVKYKFENYTLDVVRRELRCDGIIRPVEPQVFDLLHFLIKNCDRVVSRDNIFEAVWRGRVVSEAVLSTRINAARRAIGDDGTQQRLIKTSPRNGFRFIGAVRETRAETNVPILIPPDKLSLAIVSSTAGGGDEELARIANGITDDLTDAVVRSRSFEVIAPNRTFSDGDDPRAIGSELGVRYLIICGPRRASDQVRLTVRLIEGSVGLHIWVRSYMWRLDAGFNDQDSITVQIAAAIESCIFAAEARRQRGKPLDALDAVGCATSAFALLKFRTPRNYAIAESLLRRAIELAPDFVRAHSFLAYLYGIQVLWGWRQRQSTMPLALEAASKAILLDEQDAWAHLSVGWALTQNRQPEDAVEEYRKALAINPYFPMAHTCLGLALSYLGQNERALAALDDRDRLNVPEVFAGHPLSARASVYACAEKCADAIKAARRSIRQAPDLVSSQQHLIVNSVSVGEMEQARATLRSLTGIRPNCLLSTIADSLPYVRDSDVNRTLEAFHLLGFR
jgi:DNA-binding winged helix-turn-helix (wHTH) protein/Tfp pilus assembly protein PilF